ncbi:hypothetical protein, partial [Bacillus pumilus]|uniref:hypothetical protein n=1 Tax=Bacillus pumilus TaxID=1408 RepID=UPI003704C8D2
FVEMLKGKDWSGKDLLRRIGFCKKDVIGEYMRSFIGVMFLGGLIGSMAVDRIGGGLMSIGGGWLGG